MIIIKPTHSEEAPHLVRWFEEPGVLRWFPMINEREVEDAVRLWMAYCKMGSTLTAYKEGKPCGMALLYLQPFKKLAHQCLFSIIVDAQQRGQGIGSQLLNALERIAKEKFHIELLHLEVYDGNPAKRLYERQGFQEYGRQEHFVKEEGVYRAKIFMQKVL